MDNLSKDQQKQLIAEQQIDAVKRTYAKQVDVKAFGTLFPISHPSRTKNKRPILASLHALPA